MPTELTAGQIRPETDPKLFACDSTEQMVPFEGIIGQDRALSALKFGLNIAKPGFNVYVAGLAGTGRTTAIKAFLEALAAKKPVPPDWCYVHNFKDAYYPKALKVPAGMGAALQKDVRHTVENARKSLVQAFGSKEYTDRRAEITEAFAHKRDAAFEMLSKKAESHGLALKATPIGLLFVPVSRTGEPLTEEAYNKLPARDKEELKRRQEELTKELKKQMDDLRAAEAAVEKQLEDTDRQVARYSIGHLFDELKKKYDDRLPQVAEYLNDVQEDMIENYEQFKAEPRKGPGTDPAAMMQEMMRSQTLRKYEVNVLVDNSALKGAPVVVELNPTFSNLFGRIEKEAQFGALYTDFTMMKGGSFHRANGGFLVVRLEDLAVNFQSWEGLKRTLRDGKLVIEEIGERFGFVAMKSLRPEPVPLDTKVIVIGEPYYYYLLWRADPEFKELFKVKADFDTQMEKTESNMKDYAAVICRMCTEENLRQLHKSALARVMDYSARLAGEQGKLSTLFADIADVIREASYWAGEGAGADGLIQGEHIEKALEQKVYRSNLIQERLNEMIQQGTIMIDTDGEEVGQVNGLEVLDLGDFMFGKPARITATVGVGREGLIDIEREARLGGPIHTKGVLILNGYLHGKYAGEFPLSLAARLVFEQSYGGVEGDSASSTELYALLSRLANLPVKQYLSVTGSVNQKGEVQAIGGVNEKIEGYFEVCRQKGLTGKQGVLIPESNVRNLMLKSEVVEAVRARKFHIHPVSTIDEGIEVLTGVKAGRRREDGGWEKDTVNDLVQKRLSALAERLREFGKGEEKEKPRADNNNEEKARPGDKR